MLKGVFEQPKSKSPCPVPGRRNHKHHFHACDRPSPHYGAQYDIGSCNCDDNDEENSWRVCANFVRGRVTLLKEGSARTFGAMACAGLSFPLLFTFPRFAVFKGGMAILNATGVTGAAVKGNSLGRR